MSEFPPPPGVPAAPADHTPPATRTRPRPVAGVGTAAVVLLLVGSALLLPMFLSTWTDYARVAEHVGGRLGEDAFWQQQYDALGTVLMTMLLAMPVLIAWTVALLVWIHRARTNAELIAPQQHFRHSPAFSVVGMVVPFANLWWSRPILEDIWTGSRPAGEDAAPVRTWWYVSIAGTAISLVGQVTVPTSVLTYNPDGSLVEGGGAALNASLATAVFNTVLLGVGIAGILLLVRIVRQVTRWQTAALFAPRPA